jgi:hypothetical protein
MFFMSNTGGEGRIPRFNYDKFEVPSNLHLTMHFAPHQTAADLPYDVKDIMHTSDAVIIEAVGAIKDHQLEVLNGVAQSE